MEATRPTRKLTAMAAYEAVRVAVTRAEELGVAVNASVVDAGGREIAFLRGTGPFCPRARSPGTKPIRLRDLACRPVSFTELCPGNRTCLRASPVSRMLQRFPAGCRSAWEKS